MAIIHPTFEQVAKQNYAFASACSEMFITPSYTFAQPSDVYINDENKGFPPEPSEILSVVGSYIETNPSTGKPAVRTQYVGLTDNQLPGEIVGEIYGNYIGSLQDSFNSLHQGMLKSVPELGEGLPGIRDYCVRSTIRSEGSLVAAHLIARTVNEGNLIQAVAYPKLIDNDIGFDVRNYTVNILPDIHALRTKVEQNASEEELQQGDDIIQSILRMDGRMRIMGTMAAASVLPEANTFKAAMSQN